MKTELGKQITITSNWTDWTEYTWYAIKSCKCIDNGGNKGEILDHGNMLMVHWDNLFAHSEKIVD